ncbi:MAG: flagellar FlbD family protein [Anaerolineaceae bacterium]
MILLTRFNGTQFYINAELIQTVEETPNTVVTLLDRTRFVVVEPAATVAERFVQYKQKINQPLHLEDHSGS